MSRVGTSDDEHNRYHTQFIDVDDDFSGYTHPRAFVMAPVFHNNTHHDDDSSVVAVLLAVVSFDRFFGGLLPEGTDGIDIIVSNSCGQVHTYKVFGRKVSSNH